MFTSSPERAPQDRLTITHSFTTIAASRSYGERGDGVC
jgi:hypothetical protein